MRAFFTAFCLFLGIFGDFGVISKVFSQTSIPLECDYKGLDPALVKNIIAGNIPCPTDSNVAFEDILGPGGLFSRSGILGMINVAIAAISLLFFGIAASRMVLSNGDSDQITKSRTQILYIVVGLLVVSGAEIVAFQILNPTEDIIEGGRAILQFRGLTKSLLGLVKYVAGGLMLILLLGAGLTLVTSGDSDDIQSKGKTFISATFVGMFMVILAEGGVLLLSIPDIAPSDPANIIKDATEWQAKQVIKQIRGAVRFLLSFVGVVSVGVGLYAALLWATNFGNEEQSTNARQYMMGSVVGIILALSSWSIINILLP